MRKKIIHKSAIYPRSLLALAVCSFFIPLTPFFASAASQPPVVVQPEQPSLHSPAWSFGQSPERHNDLWHKGVNAKAVKQRALPPKAQKEAVDTSGGIKKALNEASKGTESGVGLSMDNRSSTWKTAPNEMRADELRPRDRQHVVRAFADVKANEDLDISIGPELILRDERVGEESAHEKQPDTSLGLGMQFKYDF